MARDTAPIVKQSRREGVALAPKAHKIMAKKSGIPGEHGDMRVRGGSLYLTQLREKQKVRRMYGLLEKQFAKLMREAVKADGLTGETKVAPKNEKSRLTPYIWLPVLMYFVELVTCIVIYTLSEDKNLSFDSPLH